MQAAPPRPYVVTVIPDTPTPAREFTISDLLVGAVSMAAIMLVAALVLGAVTAGVRVAFKRLFPPSSDHMPRVSPVVDAVIERESTIPPSSQPQ